MDERRAKTLEALSTFIDAQKALLQRTQTDIARLKELRTQIASTPEDSCNLAVFKDELESHRLSEREDIVAMLPKDIDWSVFAKCDPTLFRTLAANSRLAHKQRREPSQKQQSPLSPLQQLVKAARVTIIDPVLNSFPPLSSDEEEEPWDPEELKRIRERDKIKELKRRRIHGGSSFFGLSGLGLRKLDTDAVYVREDVDDESAEVDISVIDHGTRTRGISFSSLPEIKMEINTPPISVASPPFIPQKTLSSPHGREKRSSRAKRPTRRTETQVIVAGASPSGSNLQPSVEDDQSKLDKRGKPRPETYKQAWSVSEQHLLERLLEEIPEGEKNRWAKISQAMNGRRTARQVASRVQKYYEKLKRYGLDVGTSSNLNNDS